MFTRVTALPEYTSTYHSEPSDGLYQPIALETGLLVLPGGILMLDRASQDQNFVS